MNNNKPLCRINTMLMGHVVTADVVGISGLGLGKEHHTYHCRFVCHTETGKTRLCLDLGQNWYAEPGMTFTARKCNIDRAAKLLRKPAPEFVVTAEDVIKIQLAIF